MKKYFETDNGILYCGDCGAAMRELRDSGMNFDFCLTDPPYGINEAATKNKSRGNLRKKKTLKNPKGTIIPATDYGNLSWDNSIPPRSTFEEICKISKNQIIFGGNYFVEYLKNSPCWLVWDKDRTGDFADAELIYTSFKTAVRIYKFRWNGMLQENMRDKEKRYHPTQKPIELVSRIISDYVLDGSSVIDPFLGSGTTAIACENRGLRWVGIERETQYCAIAAERIEKAASQVKF